MVRLEARLVEPVHILQVVLGGVHQLNVVPVLVGVLHGTVRPHSLDGVDEVGLEDLGVLLVVVLLDLEDQGFRGLTLTLYRVRYLLSGSLNTLRHIETSSAPRHLSRV